jgi:hypothetical protein
MDSHERPADSKTCSKCGKTKPLAEFGKVRGKPRNDCKECVNERSKQSYQRNKESVLKRCAEYRCANQDKVKAYMSKWYNENKEHVLNRCKEYNSREDVRIRESERQKAYYLANRDEIQDRRKRYYEENPEAQKRRDEWLTQYYEKNKPKFAAKALKRLAKKLQAIPPWADMDAIEAIYKEAARVTAETGIPHEVDHIIPLQGKSVSGLHVETNLRVITASANRSKGNKFTTA